MKLFIILIVLLEFPVLGVKVQQISSLVIDANTKQPVPYATVQYKPIKGVITNEEGKFSFQASLLEEDTITISSLGYLPLSILYKDFKNEENIYLKSANIELKDVFLTNRNFTGEEVIKRVKEKISTNYNFGLTQKRFFSENQASIVSGNSTS